MNISDIITKCYILALIIRDDGERLLLGDGFYEFTEQLQHFQPNIFQNDVIELQGTDGQLLAGQVRRGATQSFDGYIADATTSREATEEHRQRFLAFFRKKHHYKVVYVFPDGSAIKRERGYIVDAPSVPEMFQRFPEFHVGLNFEDVNYYEYEEGEDGEEIFAHVQNIAIAANAEGGLIWDAFGAVSNEKTWLDWENGITVDGLYTFNNGLAGAPLEFTQLDGNATQFTTTGKNLFGASQGSRTDNGVTSTIADGIITLKNTTTASGTIGIGNQTIDYTPEGGDTYTFTIWLVSGSATFTLPDDCGFYIRKPDGTSYASGASLVMSRIRQYGYQTTTFTAPDATPMRFLISANKAGIAFNNVVLRVQLEKSSSRTDWEPYTGKAASPSPSYPQTVNVVSNEQNVRITKKNRLPIPADWSQNVNGLQVDCVGGVYKLQGRATSGSSTSWHDLKEPYTVRSGDYFHLGNTITDQHVNVQFLFSDSVGSGIVGSPSEIGRVISLDQYAGRTLDRVRCNFNANFDLDIEMKPMILHNITTATEFEPYQSHNYTIDLGSEELAKIPGTSYKDAFKRVDGVWYKHTEIGKQVYIGDISESWSLSATYTQCARFTSNLVAASSATSNVICDHFTKGVGGTDTQNIDINGGTRKIMFTIDKTLASTAEELRTWLASNNTTVYYVLATATDTQIIEPELLAQLNAIASTFDGVNNITITPSAGAQGELSVHYATGSIDVGAGYEWDAAQGGGPNILDVDGIDRTGFVWEVVGPATNPTLTNITTNQTMTFEGDVAAGQTLTVNTSDQTAEIAGTNVFAQMEGDWMQLAPGNNVITYTATGATEPSKIKWNGVVG